jgi:predicted metal-dependent hydrolase
VSSRHVPDRPFPAYAYRPGRDPHPHRDPAGHSFGRVDPQPAHVAAARWRDSTEYLWGVDLYNAGYFWEAHEAWEGAWRAATTAEPLQAEYLQGLIQCAAACLKIRDGRASSSAKRLAARGLGRLRDVVAATGGSYMGLDLHAFAAAFAAFVAARVTGAAVDAPPPTIALAT